MPTCPCNLHPLCRRHHRVKQADGWHVTRDPVTGRTSWTSPHRIIGHTAPTPSTSTSTNNGPIRASHPPAEPPGDTEPPATAA